MNFLLGVFAKTTGLVHYVLRDIICVIVIAQNVQKMQDVFLYCHILNATVLWEKRENTAKRVWLILLQQPQISTYFNWFLDEIVTDVSLTGIRSYITLNSIEIEGTKFQIQFEMRILSDQGIILFMGKKDLRYLCLSLQNGLLEVKVQSGKQKFIINHTFSTYKFDF